MSPGGAVPAENMKLCNTSTPAQRRFQDPTFELCILSNFLYNPSLE